MGGDTDNQIDSDFEIISTSSLEGEWDENEESEVQISGETSLCNPFHVLHDMRKVTELNFENTNSKIWKGDKAKNPPPHKGLQRSISKSGRGERKKDKSIVKGEIFFRKLQSSG